MFKGQKGITLVALVITIIVLLILAGVALARLIGDDNIISNANNAVEQYKDAAQADNYIIEQENALLNTYMNK